MIWKLDHKTPVFLQLASHLRNEIVAGKYAADEQIPSVRVLAAQASVNPNTMQKALLSLEEEGLLYTRGTLGRFVTSDIDALEGARERMKRDAVQKMLSELSAMGISKEELIQYIQKEEVTL
jgi:DNA-binding transcriptional regulator YhcF (GntR family)